jgi:hypothetical protein
LTEGANINRIVESKSINSVIAEQQQGVINDVLLDLRPAVVRPRTEARVGAITAIQVDPSWNLRSGKAAESPQQVVFD